MAVLDVRNLTMSFADKKLYEDARLARSCRSRAISSGRKTPRSAIWINMLIFRRG